MSETILDLELDEAPATPAATRVLVPAALPAMPLVLADDAFLRRLAFFEERVRIMGVDSPEAAQQCAAMLTEITGAGRDLDKARVELKKPFLEIGRAIDAKAAEVTKRIDAAKGAVKRHLSDWEQREAARLREIERQRQAEIARLEAEKRKEEEAARARAAELAAQAKPAEVTDELEFEAEPEPAPKTEIDRQLEAAKFAPTPVAAVPTGVRYRSRLLFRVESADKLPDQYVIRTPNERLIRETYVTGWKEGDAIPEIPGVVFSVDKTVESTGRGGKQPEQF